jgi:cobalt-zinc-cadmium efflux system outer membrane protein
MSSQPTPLVWIALTCCAPPTVRAQDVPQQWSEPQVIERFLAQSPQSRELRARVALTEAEARTRAVYSNPSVAYAREGAGYNEFIEASQILPVNGRIRYLREAGAAAVSVAEANREATLWSLRSDVRVAFYRMIASQYRLRILSTGTHEVEQLIRILRQREDEGEGSRYDRLRAEREAAELRTDITTSRSLIAAVGARLATYLPEGTRVQEVRGELPVSVEAPDLEGLIRRAMNARADYRAEQKSLARYQIEEQGARRLRIPEPQVAAGLKRADVTSGLAPNPFSNVTRTGLAISLSVPLPLFNNGRYEVARYQAEQEQANARIAVLTRQIRTEIQGAYDVLTIRQDALAAYQHELESAGAELTRITQVAYQEGEIGILELLDSLRVSRAANLRMLDLQAGVKEAFIELERVVGEEVRP